MEKKEYLKPQMVVVEISESESILAASVSVSIDTDGSEGTIGSGEIIGAKKRSSLWDFDEDE